MINSDGERAPPGQHWETRRRKGLLITGPILFGVGYILSAGYGALGYLFSRPSNGTFLLNLIPLGGPALSLVVLSGSRFGTSSFLFLEVVFAAIVTALQITGVTLAILGIPSREVLVDDEKGAPPGDRRDSKLPPIQWSIAPFAPGAPLGLSLLIRN